ncbi:NAS-domain-containing protein [Lophiostoma macrostomum CBS 122681]|uniref:NAS-domain-containing protein n=1 Tax=Lophiostoma macrostomum CBS 122681 TaxID=1314788 RepID=A0A6A6TAQ2_9PLEO|nr:NAS-domain-containing protein [Lophiostoma macrostomum CBS 122681]
MFQKHFVIKLSFSLAWPKLRWLASVVKMPTQTSPSVNCCNTIMSESPLSRPPICPSVDFRLTFIGSRDIRAYDTPPATPTQMDSFAHQLVKEIRSIYSSLQALSGLKPSPQVDTLLTRLVEICTASHSEALASYLLSLQGVDGLFAALRVLCAAAEGELEKYWTLRILDTSRQSSSAQPKPSWKSTKTLLASFPYYQNYVDLSRLEFSSLEAFLPACSTSCRPSPCKLAFIGSGPLPLTSLCVLERYQEAIVHNVDRDADAVRDSRDLARALGLEDRMTWACEDVGGTQRMTNWKDYQVIFLAALVGMDSQSKVEILAKIAKEAVPGTLVVVRSARGLRGVLYPVLELEDGVKDAGYEILAVVHPWTKVVNSIVILKVKSQI